MSGIDPVMKSISQHQGSGNAENLAKAGTPESGPGDASGSGKTHSGAATSHGAGTPPKPRILPTGRGVIIDLGRELSDIEQGLLVVAVEVALARFQEVSR